MRNKVEDLSEVRLGEEEDPIVIRVNDAWKRLIFFCQRSVPHGDVTIRLVNGSPTDLLSLKRKIRFDRPLTQSQILDEGELAKVEAKP